ncbi:hypothetical protein ACFL2H_11480 [Planctomycetota bacterium]
MTWNDPTNSDLTDDTKTLASIVAVADSVAELLASEDKGASLIRAHRLARDLLGISMGEIERMFEHSESELKDTLAKLTRNRFASQFWQREDNALSK